MNAKLGRPAIEANGPSIDGSHACTTLSNGVPMPWLGLGTAGVWTPYHKSSQAAPALGSTEGVAEAVGAALDLGYRHIDTAPFYSNEGAVGHGIAAHRIEREQVFLTTKVWNDDIAAGPEATRASIESSLTRLGVDAVDLLLLHWPVPGYRQAWRVLEDAYAQGKTRAIGVSNFQIPQLEELLAQAIAPMVNQVEFHPYLVQPELLRFCRAHAIQHQGWSPLMVGRVDEVPEITRIADPHGKTPFQVAIRWALQHESVTIPKSVKPARIAENADVFSLRSPATRCRPSTGSTAMHASARTPSTYQPTGHEPQGLRSPRSSSHRDAPEHRWVTREHPAGRPGRRPARRAVADGAARP